MDIRYLRSFVAVAQCLSFTKAAERIYIGQSALSKQIADLEAELGVELFMRHHRSLELTPAGKTLLKEGINLIDKVAEMIEKTRQAQLGIRGNINIGCFGLEDAFLPYVLKRFHSLYPQIKMDICVLTMKAIETALEAEEIDVGFIPVFGKELPASKFMLRLIQRAPLCFLLPAHHPCAAASSLDIGSLAKDAFIILSETEMAAGFNWFMKFCTGRGFTPRISSKTTRMESIYWQVEAGIGVSFTADSPALLRHVPAGIAVVGMQGEDAFANIVAVWKKSHYNPAVPLFLKVLEDIDFQQQNEPSDDLNKANNQSPLPQSWT